MLIYDDVFKWNGWGGVFKLASGKCRLRIYDFNRNRPKNLTLLKPIVVVASDLVEEDSTTKHVSIRSCAGHLATCVTQEFRIDPDRMVFVEYYPRQTYGRQQEHIIEERFDAVDFKWQSGKALFPKWRPLQEALTLTLRGLIKNSQA